MQSRALPGATGAALVTALRACGARSAAVVALAFIAACSGPGYRAERPPADAAQAESSIPSGAPLPSAAGAPSQAERSRAVETGNLEEITVTGARLEDGGSRASAERRARMAAAETALMRRTLPPGSAVTPTMAGASVAVPLPMTPSGVQIETRDARPLARVQPGEEVWVIELASTSEEPAERDDVEPGSGAMLALVPWAHAEPREIPLPLEHTAVRAQVHGYIGTVDVTQQFHNPYDEKIEAVYLLPLPEKAAVNEFVMTIGERKIRGILREKEEAVRIYDDARAQGYRASLLVQHRPNIFEQKVANIEPGKRIDVNIRYFHTLAYDDGWYSFVFPTVVGPRYNPPGAQNPVAAVPRENVVQPANGISVRYLRPDERSAHDISITVDVDAGVAIEELKASHPIKTERSGASAARVELAGGSTLPNRDFTLSFRVAGETIKSNLLTYEDPDTGAGYFTLMIYPPSDLGSLDRRPVEMVFVVDTSGSMAGRPLEQAAAAIDAALGRLLPNDTFQILSFSDNVGRFTPTPMLATPANIAAARNYVHTITPGGGTEMLSGIRAALEAPSDAERARFVTFLTDGYIGNETEILSYVQRTIGGARVFSFGVGNSVNRYLLDGLAREGRGAASYLGLQDSAHAVMAFYFDRISRPALTDLAIEWNGLRASDVYPARLPDLFVGRPVVVTGKYSGDVHDVIVRGRAGSEKLSLPIPATAPSAERASLRSIWARLRIEDLGGRQLASDQGRPELARAIRDTALEHGLMSDYTAFIAVDASERTAGNRGTTVFQPVPVPDGVRYDTTVAEEQR